MSNFFQQQLINVVHSGSRVIRMDQGHALLVGVGGSGRQSLARLAAFAAGYEVFEITLSRGYGEEEFREDLKQLYHKLGLENKKVRAHTKNSVPHIMPNTYRVLLSL